MELTSRSIRLMGTTITLAIFHQNADQLLDQACRQLIELEHRFSANDPSSELMQLNHQAGRHPVCLHPDLFHLLSIGTKHSLAPDSRLNIAIGPLVQLWRIGFADARVPEEAEIQRALGLINPHAIELDPRTNSAFLTQAGMKVDLGALAKGFAADQIADFFINAGVRNGLINLGGNVLTIGNHPLMNRPWQIGIQNPKLPRGNHLAILTANNQSVVTSGIYERTLTYQGQTYHHIFDSQTGYPVKSEVASITIVSDLSLDGEIWTTRLFGAPVQSIIQQVEATPAIEVLIVTHDNTLIHSSGLTL